MEERRKNKSAISVTCLVNRGRSADYIRLCFRGLNQEAVQMYQSNGKEKLIELHSLPKSEPGAPIPMVLSDENNVVVAYSVFDATRVERWNSGATEWEDVPEKIGLVKFHGFAAFQFGSPNDETIEGHPLHGIGLEPYSNYKVENSPWIQALEKANSVHPMHDKKRYASLSHYILTFHDSTFECVTGRITVRVEDWREHRMLKFMEDYLVSSQDP